MRNALAILWPSFIAAAAATVGLFTVLDPVDLGFVGPFELGRMAGYTIAFFFFWALGAMSSWLTWLLERSAAQVNRCPLAAAARPLGCPKREAAAPD